MIIALLLVIVWFGNILIEIHKVGNTDNAVKSDAILVLGAAQYNGRPSPVFRARLDHALALYKKRLAPKVVVVGGKARGDTYTEADSGVHYLLRRGIPSSSLVAVPHGRSTYSSLRAAKNMLQPKHVRSLIIVSDRFHMYRSLEMAKSLGFRVTGSPTPDSPIDKDPAAETRYVIREALAYTAYRISGR